MYNNSVPGRIQSRWTLAAFPPIQIMLKRTLLSFAVLSVALAADAAAQSVVPNSTTAIGPAKPDLFIRIIANQKKGEAALDLYERVERVEARKNPSDPPPTSIKIPPFIPSGLAITRIPIPT